MACRPRGAMFVLASIVLMPASLLRAWKSPFTFTMQLSILSHARLALCILKKLRIAVLRNKFCRRRSTKGLVHMACINPILDAKHTYTTMQRFRQRGGCTALCNPCRLGVDVVMTNSWTDTR